MQTRWMIFVAVGILSVGSSTLSAQQSKAAAHGPHGAVHGQHGSHGHDKHAKHAPHAGQDRHGARGPGAADTVAFRMARARDHVRAILKKHDADGDTIRKVEVLVLDSHLADVALRAKQQQAAMRAGWLMHAPDPKIAEIRAAIDAMFAAQAEVRKNLLTGVFRARQIVGEGVWKKVAPMVHQHLRAHVHGGSVRVHHHAQHAKGDDGHGQHQHGPHDHGSDKPDAKQSHEKLHEHFHQILKKLHGKGGQGNR